VVGEAGELLANFSVSDFRSLSPEHLGVLALPVAVIEPSTFPWRTMLVISEQSHVHPEQTTSNAAEAL